MDTRVILESLLPWAVGAALAVVPVRGTATILARTARQLRRAAPGARAAAAWRGLLTLVGWWVLIVAVVVPAFPVTYFSAVVFVEGVQIAFGLDGPDGYGLDAELAAEARFGVAVTVVAVAVLDRPVRGAWRHFSEGIRGEWRRDRKRGDRGRDDALHGDARRGDR